MLSLSWMDSLLFFPVLTDVVSKSNKATLVCIQTGSSALGSDIIK